MSDIPMNKSDHITFWIEQAEHDVEIGEEVSEVV